MEQQRARDLTQETIDTATRDMSRDEYREFLDWLESEADARLNGLDEDEARDGEEDEADEYEEDEDEEDDEGPSDE